VLGAVGVLGGDESDGVTRSIVSGVLELRLRARELPLDEGGVLLGAEAGAAPPIRDDRIDSMLPGGRRSSSTSTRGR
jgi:hypothetical protein